MKVLSGGPDSREERPAMELVHDEENARVVAFHLQAGQVVPPHHSAATVIVVVVAGTGVFAGADGEAELSAGQSAAYEPGETHSIRAVTALRFLAIIAPRPGTLR